MPSLTRHRPGLQLCFGENRYDPFSQCVRRGRGDVTPQDVAVAMADKITRKQRLRHAPKHLAGRVALRQTRLQPNGPWPYFRTETGSCHLQDEFLSACDLQQQLNPRLDGSGPHRDRAHQKVRSFGHLTRNPPPSSRHCGCRRMPKPLQFKKGQALEHVFASPTFAE